MFRDEDDEKKLAEETEKEPSVRKEKSHVSEAECRKV